MKQIFLLLLLSLGMLSINVSAQKRFLKTGENGFQWYELYKDGISGAEGMDGRTLIPLSRGYNTIMYEAFKNGKGHFLVIRDKKYGVCDITGWEIIAPDKYDFVNYHEVEGCVGYYTVSKSSGVGACDITGKEILPCLYDEVSYSDVFIYKKTYDGDYIRTNIKLDKQNKSLNSASKNYSDAKSFCIKGKVKSCTWINGASGRYDLRPLTKTLYFDRSGFITNNDIKIERDNNNRIKKMENDRTEILYVYNNEGTIDYLIHGPKQNRNDLKTTTLLTVVRFSYDNRGRVTTASDYHGMDAMVGKPYNTVNFNYIEFDDNGNWTKRKFKGEELDVFSMTTEEVTFVEQRVIEYYP